MHSSVSSQSFTPGEDGVSIASSRPDTPTQSTSNNSWDSTSTEGIFRMEGSSEEFDINTRYDQGKTCLMQWAIAGQIDLIAEALPRVDDINAQDFNGCTALMYAAGHGQVDIVQLLLQNRAFPNAQSEDDKTALMHSLSLLAHPDWEPIWLQMAGTLLKGGANLNIKCNEGKTVLVHVALAQAEGGYAKRAFAMLLEAGASPDYRDNEGWTALMHVITWGSQDLFEMNDDGTMPEDEEQRAKNNLATTQYFVETLLNKKANVNIADQQRRTALSYAIEVYPAMAKFMLQAKYLSLHSQEAISSCDVSARGPLHWAILQEQADIVSTLLAAKADINVTGPGSEISTSGLLFGGEQHDSIEVEHLNALMYAILQRHDMSNVERLLQAGMKADTATPKGITALSIAAARGNRAACELLLNARVGRANPNAAVTYQGLTPLMFAAGVGSNDCVELLLDMGAEVRDVDHEGRMAKHYAVDCGKTLPGGNKDTIATLDQAESERIIQDGYHCGNGMCHRSKTAAADCCRNTATSSRCCDREGPITIGNIGNGPAQSEDGPGTPKSSRRRGPRPNTRACETCEVCDIM